MTPRIECRSVTDEWSAPLAEFFRALRAAGDERWFHPHPVDDEHAEVIASYDGADLYYIITEGDSILAYGMLRGWDRGFSVPSLGMAVHPGARGSGIGRMLLEFLHAAARRRGAEMIRLKVYPENAAARGLYERFGYEFTGEEEKQLVGYVRLTSESLAKSETVS